MSLISILNQIAGKLSFPTEEEKTLFHEQIHALGDDAVTDVKALVHGVEEPVATEAQDPGAQNSGGSPVVGGDVPDIGDPLAGFDVAALEAEIAKRQGAAT